MLLDMIGFFFGHLKLLALKEISELLVRGIVFHPFAPAIPESRRFLHFLGGHQRVLGRSRYG